MSLLEANELIKFGKFWQANVWQKNTPGMAEAVCAELAKWLDQYGIKCGRGFQNYDPVVRAKGRPDSYDALTKWAAGKDDGGKALAAQFIKWYSTSEVAFADLPGPMQAFAVITHWAEVGRGYGETTLQLELHPWMAAIAAAADAATAKALWRDYRKRYTPSLKYAEDQTDEYIPPPPKKPDGNGGNDGKMEM